MNAEIISIGTEILRGETTDTNASWLAAQLPLIGVDLHWVTQVGDQRERLIEAFHRAWDRSDIILATGGLGPTADDLTRESIAEMLGETLEVDPAQEENLRGFFTKLGWEMPPHNIKQATLIPSARAIPNPNGTAPGWWVEKDGRVIVAMPGPPREVQTMWKEQALPRLIKLCTGKVIACRTLKTVGLSEAGVDEMVGPLLSSSTVEIGIYAKSDGIHIQLVAKDPERESAEQKIRDAEASLRGILEEHIWGVDDDTLMGIVGKLLIDRGQSLATMESYTGGLLAALFGEESESSRYYKGGFVIGSRETEPVFFDQGAEGQKSGPEELALAMAATARKRLGADIGIAIAESGDADENEAIVSIAVEDRQKKRTSQRKWPTYRRSVRPWIAVSGLVELRQFLL